MGAVSDLESLSTKRRIRGTETAMNAAQQDAFAALCLAEEGVGSLVELARKLLEVGVNEMMTARADAVREVVGTTRNGFRERASRRRSARSRPGCPSPGEAPTSRKTWPSGGVGSTEP